MKNYLNKIIVLLVAFSLMQSCETDKKTIDDVFDNVERGAVLRTVDILAPTFDFYDKSSEWIVSLESQDSQNGDLLTEINIYSTFVDNGSIGTEAFVKAVTVEDFTTGPFGFPRGDVAVSLQEVLNAAGLQDGDYDSGDSFNLRLESVLNDGRTFTSTNTAGTITGGSFYSSPFQYSAQFFCTIEDASIFDGNYIVVTDVWADYNPGDVVPVEFVSEFTFRILSSNNPFITNGSTCYMEVTINPADGSVTVESNECFAYDGWECVDILGTGSVGTCTGSIDLALNFVGWDPNSGFSLVKQ